MPGRRRVCRLSTNPPGQIQGRPRRRIEAVVPSAHIAVAKRSPILGYNHNVQYRGVVFHVQTEDSGIVNPHIFTHLFHAGVIVNTRKLVYDPEADDGVVKSLMQAQHKVILKELRRGVFDDKIDVYLADIPGLLPRGAAGAGGEVDGEAAPAKAEPAAAPPVAAPPPAPPPPQATSDNAIPTAMLAGDTEPSPAAGVAKPRAATPPPLPPRTQTTGTAGSGSGVRAINVLAPPVGSAGAPAMPPMPPRPSGSIPTIPKVTGASPAVPPPLPQASQPVVMSRASDAGIDLGNLEAADAAEAVEVYSPPLPPRTPTPESERPGSYAQHRKRETGRITGAVPAVAARTVDPMLETHRGRPPAPDAPVAAAAAARTTASALASRSATGAQPVTTPPSNRPRTPTAPRVSPAGAMRPRGQTPTGAVVMSRPAVIVGGPRSGNTGPVNVATPPATAAESGRTLTGVGGAGGSGAVPGRVRKAREDSGRGVFGQDLISEKSLDEVILAYLSEDGSDDR